MRSWPLTSTDYPCYKCVELFSYAHHLLRHLRRDWCNFYDESIWMYKHELEIVHIFSAGLSTVQRVAWRIFAALHAPHTIYVYLNIIIPSMSSLSMWWFSWVVRVEITFIFHFNNLLFIKPYFFGAYNHVLFSGPKLFPPLTILHALSVASCTWI